MPGDFDFDSAPVDPVQPRPATQRDLPRPTVEPVAGTPRRSSTSPLLVGAIAGGGVAVLAAGVIIFLLVRDKPTAPATKDKGHTPVVAATTGRPPAVVAPKKEIDPNDMSDATQALVKKATVRVLARWNGGKSTTGTGFVEKQSRLVITNAHVIGEFDDEPGVDLINLVVNSGEGKDKEYHLGGELLAVDTKNDLALIRPYIIEVGARHVVPDGIVVPRNSSPRERQRLFVFGYPFGSELGKEITIGETSISSLRKDNAGKLTKIQVQGGLNPGNSGGPLVDAGGNVVAVAVSIIKGTDLNFAIPGEIVAEFIARNKR